MHIFCRTTHFLTALLVEWLSIHLQYSSPMLRVFLTGALLLCISVGTTTGNHSNVRWEVAVDANEIVMNPVVVTDPSSGRILTLVPTNTSVYAIDLSTGAALWRSTLVTTASSVCSSVGYVSACEGTFVYVGCIDKVVALFMTNGSVAWARAIPPSTAPPYNAARHVRADCDADAPEWLFIASFNAPLMLLSSGDGTLIRDFSDEFPGTFAKDHVHVTSHRIVFLCTWAATRSDDTGVAAATGTLFSAAVVLDRSTFRVAYMIGNAVNLLVDATSNQLFVRYSVNTTQTVVAYNLFSGTAMWSASEPGLFATFDYFSSEGRLFMATSMVNDAYPNNLTAYNASTGAVLWKQVIGFFYLLAGGDAVFAMGTVTYTKAYHAATGALLWENNAVAVNDGAVGDNAVVFGTASSILALNITVSDH
jgi:outer membrane protein assembly factor BamB